MNIFELIKLLNSKNIQVTVDDDKLKIDAPKGSMSQEILSLLKENKQKLVNTLSNSSAKQTNIPAISRDQDILLSFAQQRLWFLDQMEEGSSNYNLPSAMNVKGKFNLKAAENAFIQIINRHEPLRTNYYEGADGGLQVIRQKFEFKIKQIDISELSSEEQNSYIEKKIKQDAEMPFDLVEGLMIRVCHLKQNESQGVLLFNMHHIASDGWSSGVLINEFKQYYVSELDGSNTSIKPLQIQYADYAIWQRKWLSSEAFEHQLNYWERQLLDLPQVHSLPLDLKRPKYQTYNGSEIKFYLDSRTLKSLNMLALKSQSTMFMLFHAVVSIVLSRFSNQTDIVVGTPVANRMHKQLEPLIGLFVNTLVLRSDCSVNMSFIEFLEQIKQTNFNAQNNQQVPIECIVDKLSPQRSTSYNPLFQILLSMDTNEVSELGFSDVILKPHESSQINVKFDLEINAQTIFDPVDEAKPAGLYGSIIYNTDLFKPKTIERLADGISMALESIVENANQKLFDIPVFRPDETAYLLHELNNQTFEPSSDLCIHELFEEQVNIKPYNQALVFANQSITYLELNKLANQLAHYLITTQDIKPGVLLGICVERSLDMFVAILGILKAGAAYLPLDPSYPSKRLTHMISDSKLSVVITQSKLSELIKKSDATPVFIDSGEFKHELTKQSNQNIKIDKFQPDDLAYVIYTSGSTGKPKGVLIEHQGVTNHLLNIIDAFEFTETDRFLQFASMSFDTFVEQTFASLSVGGCLYIRDEAIWSAVEFYQYVNEHKITVTDLAPAYLMELMSNPQAETFWSNTSLSHVVIGGDRVSRRLLSQWFNLIGDNNCRLYNAYGPTEATITSHLKCITPNEMKSSSPVSMGKVLPGRLAYILDKNRNLTPNQLVGELYLGGNGLARGYLNQEDLTAEKFIEHQFSDGSIHRLYRTGDLVSYLNDGSGELTFIGRVDEQVKIHGFRIELGEIEHSLSQQKYIVSCAVALKEDIKGKKCIVAYYESSQSSPEFGQELKEELKKTLPKYMLPSVFVWLKKLPIDPNGKIDRKALPAPDLKKLDTEKYKSPKNEIEEKLCKIWAELLSISNDQISTNGNFFNLGGDSILSIQMVSRASEVGLKITIKQIFEFQTIELLAPHVLTVSNEVITPQGPVRGKAQLLPIQHNFFVDSNDLHHYNQGILIKPPNNFTFELMEKCFELLIHRHDALRLRFHCTNSNWYANHTPYSKKMLIDVLERLVIKERGFEKLEDYTKVIQSSFSLQSGPLFKAVYCKDEMGEKRLLIIIHHLIVDAVSWRIIVNDLECLYKQSNDNKPLCLAPKTSSFKEWGEFLQSYSHSTNLSKEISYWQNIINNSFPNFKSKVTKHSETELETSNFGSVEFSLNYAITSDLLTKAKEAYKVQINELLLSALLLACYRWSGEQSICIDLESHGRAELNSEINLSETVGWFTSIYPLQLHSNSMDLKSVICAIKEQYRATPNQGIGFGLLKYISCTDGIQNAKPAPILFNYLGQFTDTQDDLIFTFAEEKIGQLISPLRKNEHGLNFNGMVNNGCLSFNLSFDSSMYHKADIEVLSECVSQSIIDIVQHCAELKDGCLTPSDFPLSKINQLQLNKWQERYSIEDIYPATAMQEGLLFQSKLDKSAYVSQLKFTLESGVNLDVFRDSWQILLNRHQILRTVFVTDDSGQMQQLVIKKVKLPWKQINLEQLNELSQTQEIESFCKIDRGLGFELEKGPLLRFTIWHLGEERYRVLLSDHHALTDGWSMPLIFTEVMKIYKAKVTGNEIEQEAVIPFKNYVDWLIQQDQEKALKFWQEELSEIIGPTIIAEEKSANDKRRIIKNLTIERQTTDLIQKIAQESEVTTNVLLQAVWAYLLSCYSGQSTVVFGTTVSGRPANLQGVEKMVGLFINTIPVKVDISSELAFNQWIKTLQAKQIERDEYAYLPLVEIQGLVNRDKNVQLTENLFVFENFPIEDGELYLDNDIQISDHSGIEETEYKLTAKVSIIDVLNIELNGQASHYDEHFLNQLTNHYKNILLSIVEAPDQIVKRIPILSSQEINFYCESLNNTQAEYPEHLCIHQLFENQVLKTPKNIAIADQNESLTYEDLNRKANQLANYLIDKGTQSDDLIGLCFNRSFNMLVGIIATLKSGAAYLPLDPSYPEARLNYMIEDSQLLFIITEQRLAQYTAKSKCDQLILDDNKVNARLEKYAQENPRFIGCSPKDLAYVVYTSGSTGKPKGVMIEQNSLNNFCHWHIKAFNVTEYSAMAHLASVSFDAAVWEIWPSLLAGSRIQIISDDTRLSPSELIEEFKYHNVTHCFLTTALFEASFDLFNDKNNHNLKFLLTGGEKLTKSNFSNPHTILINNYGPTETTVATTYYPVSSSSTGAPPIGKSISNTKAYVLTKNLKLAPINSVGELYIGGTGLARGYLNKAELTAEKFIEHTFEDGAVERLYKTGDLVRRLSDGNLDFVGRIDNQIKFRGFRIELGEIEQQISKHADVNNCLVNTIIDKQSNKQIIAYICTDSTDDDAKLIKSIRNSLVRHLPEYMIPYTYVLTDHFPLTRNGKIDYKAIAQLKKVELNSDYITPQTDLEKKLAVIWSNLLNIPVQSVSANADFFELGGHSLLAIKLLSEINSQFSCQLSIKVVFENPQLFLLAQQIHQSKPTTRPKIKPLANNENIIKLSYAQQRLWFINEMEANNSSHYNMPNAIRVLGDFNIQVAEKSFIKIIQRHHSLRTVFTETNEGPQQIVKEKFEFVLKQVPFTHMSDSDQNSLVYKAMEDDAERPFDLSSDLKLRATYLKLSKEEGILLFNMHHIASDGWSIGVLIDEFVEIYSALNSGEEAKLPELSIQYADYAHWQRAWLSGEVLEQQLSYWDTQLADLPQVHSLRLDYERPEFQTYSGAYYQFNLDQSTTDQLKVFAKDNQVTLFMLIHAIYSILIARYSNETDVVIGTPVANRMQKELESLIGFFVNTLVLRVDCSNNPSLIDFLAQVKEVNLQAQDNQDVPFEHLVDRVNPARSTQYNALFQIMLNMNTNEMHDLKLPDVSFTPIKPKQVTSLFDLSLNVVEDEGLKFNFEYNTDLFKEESIGNMADSLLLLLKSITTEAEQKISQLPLLSEKQHQFLLHTLNDTAAEHPRDLCIHELFEQQVIKTPDNLAVVFAEQSLTYQQLNQRANQLAHYLLTQGKVKPDGFVGLCMERSLDLVVGLLAILKAGAGYLPLDPSYPLERLKHMLEDSEVDLLLTHSNVLDGLDFEQQQIVCLDQLGELSEQAVENINKEAIGLSANNLAYIIYTSGSTGKPKGAAVEHKNETNLLYWYCDQYDLNAKDKVLVMSAIGFDLTQKNLFAPLICGASLQFATARFYDVNVICDFIEKNQITLTNCAPSVFYPLVEHEKNVAQLSSLRCVLFGGEAIAFERLNQWLDQVGPDFQLINMYGPTECTDISCAYSIPVTQNNTTAPIGKPNDNVSLYVLNEYQQLTPLGVPGELCVGGLGVSRGYLNQPELTAEKFIVNPFSQSSDDKIYRTGDSVKWNAQGQLEFIGRIDNQIKIRGHRVELGEIESAVNSYVGVKQSTVVFDVDNEILNAYLVVDDAVAVDLNDLRSELNSQLPNYMIPSGFVCLDALPLNTHGKIDKKSLLEVPVPQLTVNHVKPENTTEHELLGIWSELLSIPKEQISTDANFFELGGHSLLLTSMLHQIVEQMSVQLVVKEVFQNPTIVGIGKIITAQSSAKVQLIEKQDNTQLLPLSYGQSRIWFIEQLKDQTNEHNMPVATQIKGSLDVKVLEAALNMMFKRHDILRTTIVADENTPMQRIAAQYQFKLDPIDLTALPDDDKAQQITALTQQHDTQHFDLCQLPLLSVLLLQTDQQRYTLHFNQHHLISDGWSQQLFYQELLNFYHLLKNNLPIPINTNALNYADYAVWQVEWMASKEAQKQADFWKTYLIGCNEQFVLPIQKPDGNLDGQQNMVEKFIGVDLRNQLKAIGHNHRGSLFNVLHTGFALLLARLSGEGDFNLGLPVTGRHVYGTQDMLGMFLNTLPVRHAINSKDSFTMLLKQQIDNIENILSNQDLPLEEILKISECERNTQSTPLFQILFNMLSVPEMDTKNQQLDFEILPEESAEIANKFNITLYLKDSEEGVGLVCNYNNSAFSHQHIENFIDQYISLLSQVAVNIEAKCDSYSLNETPMSVQYSEKDTVKSDDVKDVTALFRQRAQSSPEAVAIIDEDNSWSYQALLKYSHQLAFELQSMGVRRGHIVTIMASRQANLVAGILAILQTGAAYSIVTTDSPANKIVQHLKIVENQVTLLCESEASYDAGLLDKIKTLSVIKTMSNDPAYYAQADNEFASETNLLSETASVIFTSGSSGVPKAVAGSHLGLAGYLQWLPDSIGFSKRDHFGMLSGLAHDPLQRDIFGALCLGATLNIPAKTDYENFQFGHWIKEHDISVLHLTPAMAEVICMEEQVDLSSLRTVFLTGEALRKDTVDALLAHNSELQILNCYGATETQRAATYFKMNKHTDLETVVPISLSTPDTNIKLINQNDDVCGVGEIGMICTESDRVAQGYLNDSDLTKQKFIALKNGARRYMTGDLGVSLDGQYIKYLGRQDSQVNIRGYRIELGEIEYQLSLHELVKKCTVQIYDQVHIAAYFVAENEVEDETEVIKQCKTYLHNNLPPYMVPSAFIILDKIPLTVNRKVDRKSLPAPKDKKYINQFIAPETETEISLVQICSNLLKAPKEKISMTSNFFEMGGHSLLLIKLITEIRQVFKIEINLKHLFESPNLKAMAELIDSIVEQANVVEKLANASDDEIEEIEF